MASRSVDIFEDQDGREKRIMRHTFFGKDAKETKHYQRSHRKSDKFFDAAMKGKEFKGVPVHAVKRRTRRMARKTKRRSRRGY